MKIKNAAALLCAAVVFFGGCTGKNTAEDAKDAQKKINITATIFPLYDFARQIAGERANITMLLPTGAEVHSYEPTPQDILNIQNSDLFINVGGAADPWAEQAAATGKKKVNMLSASDYCNLLCEDEQHHEGHSHKDTEIDEHVWTSLKNAEKIAAQICKSLCALDSENEAFYKENLKSFTDKLTQLDKEFQDAASSAENKTLVFADRFPFKYFTADYGLSYMAAFPGCSSESEPSAYTVASLINKIKEENIGVVLYTETSNGALADVICEETGAKKMLMHSCHTVTKKQLLDGITYTELMNNNLKTVREALKAK